VTDEGREAKETEEGGIGGRESGEAKRGEGRGRVEAVVVARGGGKGAGTARAARA
jgi:hypothetical protein